MKKFLTLSALFFGLSVNAQQYVAPQIQWQRTLGSEGYDEQSSVAFTKTNGYMFFGGVAENTGDVTAVLKGGFDYWVTNLDENGTLVWNKAYGGTQDEFNSNQTIGWKIKTVPNGGYILAGSTSSNNGDVSVNYGGDDVWLVKIDENGILEWEKSYGNAGDDNIADIQITADGGYIIVAASEGIFQGIDPPYGSWITKTDALGNIEWTQTYSATDMSRLRSITQTSDGGYIAAGTTYAAGSAITPPKEIFEGFFDPNSRLWVLKINADGSFQWAKTYGGTDLDEGESIIETTEGNYVVAGKTWSADGDAAGNNNNPENSSSFWVLNLNNQGDIIWQKTYGGQSNEGAMGIKQASDGNYVIGGSTRSNSGTFPGYIGENDFMLMKVTATDGSVLWTKRFGGSGQDNLWSFDITPDEGFMAVGTTGSNDGDVSGGPVDNFDFWVVKLSSDCILPEFTVKTEYTICTQAPLQLGVISESSDIILNWYDSSTAATPVHIGAEFVVEVTQTTSYWVEIVYSNCRSEKIKILINVIDQPAPPQLVSPAVFEPGNTLADLDIEAEGTLVWYQDELLTVQLPDTTSLVNNTTYYVIQQFDNGCQSLPLSVTVEADPAGLNNKEYVTFEYYPNPVKDMLHLKTSEPVQSIQVYDMVGKHVSSISTTGDRLSYINLASLPTGIYLVKVRFINTVKEFRVVKQ